MDSKPKTIQKKSRILRAFSILYALTMVSILVIVTTWNIPIGRSLLPFVIACAGLFLFGTPTIVIAIRIIIKARNTSDKEMHAYNVFCRYAFIATLAGLILFYIANNIANRIPFYNLLDGPLISAFGFGVFMAVNLVGLTRAMILSGNDGGNREKKLEIAAVVASIVAVCGICFGIYGMTQTPQKSIKSSHDDCPSQSATQQTTTSPETPTTPSETPTTPSETPTTSPTTDEIISRGQNPIISDTASKTYNSFFSSEKFGNPQIYSVSLTVHNGDISRCQIFATRDGSVTEVKECSVEGLVGKVYKVVGAGQGQDSFENIAFIMQDGSVEYFSFYGENPVETAVFKVKGKLKIDGLVVDALTVGVGDKGATMGGYRATIFVLSDGSYIEYDNSMLD